jgi:predicted CXXCH cytochrome family protein
MAQMRRRSDFGYAFLGLCILLLLLLPAFSGFGGVLWESGEVAGLIALLACLLLLGAPIRARSARPATLLALRPHTFIGWIALVAVSLHVVCLLLADRTVLEYLKPTMPIYLWCGLIAALLLLLSCLSAVAGLRRRLFVSHRGFQATHVIASVMLLLLAAIHVLGTSRYVGSIVSRALLAGACLAALAILLRARRGVSSAPLFRGWRQGVFGRHALAVGSAVVVTAVLLVALSAAGASTKLREPLLVRSSGLPLDFPHTKHTAVPCATCHHNFVDETGLENCIACHQSARADLKVGVEARFHSFCFQCHRHPDSSLVRHGPIDGCEICHHKP